MSVSPNWRAYIPLSVVDARQGLPGEWRTWYANDVPILFEALDEAERRAETAERRLAAHGAPVEEAIEE